ncbi:TPA: hypothetical protein VAM23_001971 [Acinetobacter baumannii]|nr:hypothetical protein [Acinetobacter baumannii]
MDRKQFEEWFKTTDAFKLLEEMNYFKIDLFIFKEHRSQYQHTTVQIAYMTWQHQQAKVEEQAQEIANLKSLIQGHELRHQQNLSIKQKLTRKSEELQKRVKFLESELGAWKGKSIAAMINGMCGQCGKEPRQAIVSDKEGYALLHCFGCGANKYEWIGEQALKGDQYDEHRKKAEEAISKGASLTNHRIEL